MYKNLISQFRPMYKSDYNIAKILETFPPNEQERELIKKTEIIYANKRYSFCRFFKSLSHQYSCVTFLFFMIIARFIVGIGSAAIAPVVMSYIVTEFPPEKIAKGFSLYMLISSSAVIFGPTLGGLLIEFYGWRAMMWVCVAISVIIFFLCLVTHRKDSISMRPLADFDGIGSVWVLIFFTLMLCLPSFGQNFGLNSIWFIIILKNMLINNKKHIRIKF